MRPTLQLGTIKQHDFIVRLEARRSCTLTDVFGWLGIVPQPCQDAPYYWHITPAQASLVIEELR